MMNSTIAHGSDAGIRCAGLDCFVLSSLCRNNEQEQECCLLRATSIRGCKGAAQ